MAGVSRLEDREDYILYPDYEMGIESYYLYKHEEDTQIVGEDLSTLSGKKIGVIKNTTMEDYLRKWLADHPLDAEIIEFDGYEAEQMAFDRREIDVFAEMDFNISTGSGRAAVVKIGELPYYLAVTKGRSDLLAELNVALAQLNEVEPYFRQNLQYSNFGNSLISHTLSETEQEWIQEHDVMNVGYFEAYMPYCGSDQEGNVTGLLTDVMAEILRRLKIEDQITVQYMPYQSYEEMVADLHTGKLDVAFPVGGELWHAEQDGLFSSSPVVSAGVDLAFAGSFDEETVASIAVNKNNKMQYYYTTSNFPDATIVFCDTVEGFNDSIYSIFEEQMKTKGIAFIREIYVEHEYVYCDTLKLRELFHNILSNAYKYTPQGGKICMVLREVPSDREGYVTLRTEISDTGIGISQEYLPHLFEEFSREHTTTESKIKGTGLGMAIVKRLVELMDGQIEVDSELGKGTKFTVTIPHRIADKSVFLKEAATDVRLDEFSGKRILLAEDNDLNAEIAMELLKDAGFEIERAADGALCVDLLERAEDGYYDLILMDIQMPNMNGYEATRTIRALQDSEKANIPILAMTANAFEEDKREAYRCGMNGHLAKPINVRELMKELANILATL